MNDKNVHIYKSGQTMLKDNKSIRNINPSVSFGDSMKPSNYGKNKTPEEHHTTGKGKTVDQTMGQNMSVGNPSIGTMGFSLKADGESTMHDLVDSIDSR